MNPTQTSPDHFHKKPATRALLADLRARVKELAQRSKLLRQKERDPADPVAAREAQAERITLRAELTVCCGLLAHNRGAGRLHGSRGRLEVMRKRAGFAVPTGPRPDLDLQRAVIAWQIARWARWPVAAERMGAALPLYAAALAAGDEERQRAAQWLLERFGATEQAAQSLLVADQAVPA